MDQQGAAIAFGPFRLLPDQKQLWRDQARIDIRPMPLAVLAYLTRHAEQLVQVAELRTAIWGDASVSRTVIPVCIRELRQALGDEFTAPRYIETVGRQGYRFIGYRVSSPPPVAPLLSDPTFRAPGSETESSAVFHSSDPHFVGRVRELALLQQWFAEAQQGRRELVLLSGEPGIGKTTLLRQFLAEVTQTRPIWMGHGQCVAQYGQGESYLPLLEALRRLSPAVGVGQLKAVLLQYAPMWLAQLPALTDSAERMELHRQTAGATQERMLRELCDALEVLTVQRPIVLALEDLQWSDMATLAWLAAVSRRIESARLLVLGTYRPADVIASTHPLRGLVQDLHAHRFAEEIHLEPFSVAEVSAYVQHRLGQSPQAPELGRHLYRRTEGNPLFLAASLDALIQQEVVRREADQWVVHGDLETVAVAVPQDLQNLITKQLEALDAEDRQLIAAASVSGDISSAAEVAAGCQREPEDVEARCDELARHAQFLEASGVSEWPDGTVTSTYRFRHALYQHEVYTHLGGGQRVRLHRLIGARKEAGYGERVAEIAGELALHFELARDYERAVRYQQQAVEQALRRSGQREAVVHCQKGLDLIEHLPTTPERARLELSLRLPLAVAQFAVPGIAAEESRQNLERARTLCQELGDVMDLIPVVIGLGRFHLMRANRNEAEEMACQERRLLELVTDPALALQIHIPLGSIELFRGALDDARAHFEQALALFDADKHRGVFLSFGGDPLGPALIHAALSAWLSGQPDHARSYLERGLARAEEVSHPFTLVHSLNFAALGRLFLREPEEARRLAQRSAQMAHTHGFALYAAQAAVIQHCAALRSGDEDARLATITEDLAAYRATGARLFLPFFLACIAEAHLQEGDIENGAQVVADALALTASSLDVFWDAELYRIKGELASHRGDEKAGGSGRVATSAGPLSTFSDREAEAEACFLKAIEGARRQGAKSLELRASMSLARLWRQYGKEAQAAEQLATICRWFTEGFGTRDLQEATTLLAELMQSPNCSAPGEPPLNASTPKSNS